MMSLEIRPREQQSSSANYNYFDGDKVREALVQLYLQTIAINRNIPEQLRTLTQRQGKNWWKVVENTISMLSSYEEGYGNSPSGNRTLTMVINTVKGNITGAFKFDLAQAIVAIHLALQFNNSPIPLYIEDIGKVPDRVFGFYSTVYSAGFKGIARPSMHERNRAIQEAMGDSGDVEQPQQIVVTETVNKVPTVKTLKDNFKVFLRYMASVQDSLTILHQSTKDKKDKMELPYTRYYTYQEIKDANIKPIVLTPDGKDYLIIPKYSIYRVMLVAWICDIKQYQEYARSELYLDFIGSDIFKNSGYFTNLIVKEDRFKTFLGSLVPSSDYVTMIESATDETISQNIFRKAFLETKKYCNQLAEKGQDVTIDFDVYERDHMSMFRDFYNLLCNCDVGGENYDIYRIKDSDELSFQTNAMGLVLSVLGTEYDRMQVQGFEASMARYKYSHIVPLAADIPESKFEMSFWEDMTSIEEWMGAGVRKVQTVVDYGVPAYETSDYSAKPISPIVKDIEASSCRAILLDNGNGKYTDMLIQSIFMSLHLDVLQSFFRIESDEESLLRKIATQRIKELEEYVVFRELAPRKIDPSSVTKLPLHRKVQAVLNSTGDYNFNLFKSPVEDQRNITNGIAKVTDTELKDVISDILVLTSGDEYESLMKYSLHVTRNSGKHSQLYNYAKAYAYELLRRYIKFLFVAWEANNWSIAAQYGDEETMFTKLIETLRFEPMRSSPQSIRILHLLSKPLIINSAVGDLYSTHGVTYVVSAELQQHNTGNKVSIMTPQKNDVGLLLAQVPDKTNRGQSYTVLLAPDRALGVDGVGYSIVFPAVKSPAETYGMEERLLPRELQRDGVIHVNRTFDAVVEKRGIKI